MVEPSPACACFKPCSPSAWRCPARSAALSADRPQGGAATCQPSNVLVSPVPASATHRVPPLRCAQGFEACLIHWQQGLFHQLSRGSRATRCIQAHAVTRFQPPLASRRKLAFEGNRSSSASNNRRSTSSSKVATFHLRVIGK